VLQRLDQQITRSDVKEGRLEPRRPGKLGNNLATHPCDVLSGVSGKRSLGGPSPGQEREVDPFTRNRIDEASGIAGDAPMRAAKFQTPEGLRCERGNGPRVRVESRSFGETRATDPGARFLTQPSDGASCVGLNAASDSKMVRSGKRPDVSRRVVHHLDENLIACDAAHEIAGGD
jgi:hypothetical protein